MAYTPCYPNKRNWANLPSESSPINETNLNAMDNAIYTNDGRIVELSGRLDTDETALGNKVDKQSGKGLSEIKSITISPSVNTGTKIAEISYKNQDNLTIGYEIKNGVVVDSALSSSSENPVQNKVVKSALDGKVDKEVGKGLSSNDYTTTEKNKLAGISANATAVSISNTLQDGDTIANITIDGTTTAIKAKQPNESEMNVRSAMLLLSQTPIGENAPFVKRRSGGNVPFPALLKDKIIGASVVWNQLVKNGNFADSSEWSGSYVTISISNGEMTITPTSYTNAVFVQGNILGTIENHKYLILSKVNYNKAPAMNAYLSSGGYQGIQKTITTLNTWVDFCGIFVRETGGDDKIKFYPRCQGWESGDYVKIKNIVCIDLTAMFGSTIADYVNTLETAQEGSGVAWLKSYGFFTEPYYAYSAPTIQSVSVSGKKNVGFNQWDEEWELGYLNSTGGTASSTTTIRCKNYIPVFPSNNYYFGVKSMIEDCFRIFWYDENKNFVSSNTTRYDTNTVKESPSNARFMKFYCGSTYGTTYNHDICINISGSKNGTYEPYTETTYSLDHTTLRGLLKLDANNNLYADGDIYPSSGSGSVKYGIVDLGSITYATNTNNRFIASVDNLYSSPDNSTLPRAIMSSSKYKPSTGNGYNSENYSYYIQTNGTLAIKDIDYSNAQAFQNSMSGVYLVYLLATPTTAELTPFTELQNIASGGTEEFIDYGVSQGTRDVAIPVGGDRQYYQGMDLPALPTASGNHNLQFNPSSGFSWS